MSAIGCKSCGKRKNRNLKEEIVIIEESKPKYIINPINQIKTSPKVLDWKSMSKMI